MLDDFRRKVARNRFLEMNSFPMILGSGANGAIVHYRADPSSSSQLSP
jgi:Xaa-Pro aminopeptidase